jgi:hypothetical protein
MLWIDTAADAALMATIIATAPALFVLHNRSAKKIVLAVVAALKPIIDPAFRANGAAAGFDSFAPVRNAADVL